MVPYYGDFAEDDTVIIPINTFSSDDPSASVTATNLLNTDVHIHKDGGTTQRNNAAGITMTIDYDSITGNHLLIIDTSDNTVAGFFVTGSEYQVRVEGATVDGATINAWVGAFSIERAGGALAVAKLIQTAVIANAAGADIAADIIAIKAETALIVADTNELQADDYPTSIAAIKAETALIVADTNELQADDTPAALTAIDAKIDIIDTNIDQIETTLINNAAGVDIAADIIALKAVADAIPTTPMRGTDGANTTVPDAAGIAATPAEVATALTDIHLDHLFATDYDPASKPGVATALLNELIENDGGVSRYTANALEQAPSAGTNPNVLIDTTIAGVTDQTHFTLTAGSDIDDSYKDQAITMYDASNNDYPSVRKVSAYTGATKTVTLDSAPDFTILAGDGVKTFVTVPGTTAPTVGEIRTEMEGAGTKLTLALEDTDELQTNQGNWATATEVALNAQGKLDVNAEADTALSDYGPNTTVPDAAGTAAALHAITDAYIDTEIGQIITAVGTTLLNHLLDIKGTGFVKDTDSLPQCLTATGFSTHDAAAVKTAIEAAGSHLSLIKAVTDALTAAAAAKLAASAGTIMIGTVSHDNTVASTTVFYCDDITEATADHLNGRIVIFTSGDLQYQATSISDYELSAGEGKFTVVALTEAPADNVTFVVV